jgi:glycosyltransferase involved in cell wall biosynthesis
VAARLQGLRRQETYAAAYAECPLVSVRIGAYHPGDALFEAALASVRAQSYEHWEAVVVFDGPDPESAARVDAIGDPRIRCYQRPQRSVYPPDSDSRWLVAGVHPFNEAIAHARGNWIAPLDQDDEWRADHIEVLLDAARTTRAELVYGVCAVPLGPEGETYFGAAPPAQGDFGFQTAIYHAGIAEFMLYDYNAHLRGEPADWNLARRMLEAGVKFEFVDRIVATYHVDPQSRAFSWWQQRLAERGPFRPGR